MSLTAQTVEKAALLLQSLDAHKHQDGQHGNAAINIRYAGGNRKEINVVDGITIRPGTPLMETAKVLTDWVTEVLRMEGEQAAGQEVGLKIELSGRNGQTSMCRCTRENKIISVETVDAESSRG